MASWGQDNAHEQLDDEEIARILQEEEYELARQRQREQQARPAQSCVTSATRQPVAVVPQQVSTNTNEVLLLQSRCSAVSGTTVLNGSCYLYRNMFKFVCVERGKEVAVIIYISSIEFINPAYAPKGSGVPRVVPHSSADPNLIQIFTQDKRVHTFFNFVDNKTFQKFYNILSSIHKNHTASVTQVAPTSPALVTVAAPPTSAGTTAATTPVAAPIASTPSPASAPAPHPPVSGIPMMYPPPAYPYPPQVMFMPPPSALPTQPPPSQEPAAPGHPQPHPFAPPPPYYYYPYPMPMPVTAPPAESAVASPAETTLHVPSAAGPYHPYYFPPAPAPAPAPYPYPADMSSLHAPPPAPYPYPLYPVPSTQQPQAQAAPQQQQAQPPQASKPAEDLLA